MLNGILSINKKVAWEREEVLKAGKMAQPGSQMT